MSRQVYGKAEGGFLAVYERDFRGVSIGAGSTRASGLSDIVTVASTVEDADFFGVNAPVLFAAALALPSAKASFAKSTGHKVTYLKVGKPTLLGVGDKSVAVVVRYGTRVGEVRFVVGGVRIGLVGHLFVLVGAPRGHVGVAEARRPARLVVARTTVALVPASVAPPTIAGAPEVGQTLVASAGTWLSFPTSYTHTSGSAAIGPARTASTWLARPRSRTS